LDGAVQDIKSFINDLKNLYVKAFDNLDNLDCTPQSKQNIGDVTLSLNDIKTNFSTLFQVSPTTATPFQNKITEINTSFSCIVQQKCPNSGARIQMNTNSCDVSEGKSKFENLICEISDLKKVLESSDLFLPPVGNRVKYYYTPSGKLVSLPFDAKPRFGTNTTLNVHPSALVGFEIITGNPEYGPPGIYDARYLGNDFEGYQKRGSSDKRLYIFNNQTASLIDNEGKLSIDLVLSYVNTAGIMTAGVIEKGYTFSEIVRDLGLVLES